MKHFKTLTAALIVSLALSGSALAEKPAPDAFKELSGHYDAIRVALLSDSLSGVEAEAEALASKAADLRRDLSDVAPEFAASDHEKLASALDLIEASAGTLAKASDIEAARDELFVLTKPMVMVRKLTGDERTIVAYCSMAQKAWVQPEGELGNPYMGQKMPKCGEVVGK
jgi:phosphomevalonate kinase